MAKSKKVDFFTNNILRNFAFKISNFNYFKGKGFILRIIDRFFLVPKYPVKLKFYNSFFLKIHPSIDNGVEKRLFKRGCYEVGTIDFLIKNKDKFDTFIDVGANIGLLSIFNNRYINKDVISFEANPEIFDELKVNFDLNQINKAKIFNIGLGESEKTLFLYTNKNINRGGSSFINRSSDNESYSVQIKPLDDFLYLFSEYKKYLLKIDVEGWEINVLKGAKEILKKIKPIIILEFSKEIIAQERNSFELIELIRENNYEIFKLKNSKENPGELIKIDSNSDLPEHDNLFCFQKT